MGPRRRWLSIVAVALICTSLAAPNLAQSEAPATVFPEAASINLQQKQAAAADTSNASRCLAGDVGTCTAPAAATVTALAASASAAQPPAVAAATAKAAKPKQQLLAELAEENDWKNGLVLWTLPDKWVAAMPRVVRAWLRCYVMCMLLYLVTGGAWAYYIYFAFGSKLFAGGHMPNVSDMAEQIKVSCMSIPIYSMLPAIQEWVIEKGWTKAYSRVSDVGLGWHIACFVAFMTSVEFGVYWMHRLLHDIRLGYRLLHHIHHKYNKEHSLSPFAGLAFHPLDGILQAIPYCWTLFFIPAHFLTFEMLLFLTGIWTTNIHDCLHGKMEPIMGAGYHTVHHTTYKHNYGHYFVYMDGLFKSLVTPAEYEASLKKGGAPLKAQ